MYDSIRNWPMRRVLRSGGLSDADFFVPTCRASREQVGEVDTGESDNEKADRRNDINIADVSVLFDLAIQCRVQVDAGERLQSRLYIISLFTKLVDVDLRHRP